MCGFSSHLCFKSSVWFSCLSYCLGFFFPSFQMQEIVSCLFNCTHWPNEMPSTFSGKGFFLSSWIHVWKVLFDLTCKQNFPENTQFLQNQIFFKKQAKQKWLRAVVLSHITTLQMTDQLPWAMHFACIIEHSFHLLLQLNFFFPSFLEHTLIAMPRQTKVVSLLLYHQ